MRNLQVFLLCMAMTIGPAGCGDDDSAGACGNGAIDTGEVCDGDALGGENCVSLGQGFTSTAIVK